MSEGTIPLATLISDLAGKPICKNLYKKIYTSIKQYTQTRLLN
jgi:hypothetical protein